MVTVAAAVVFAACTPVRSADGTPCVDVPEHCAKANFSEDVTIRLARTACRSECPVYEVTIRGDGTVSWNGDRFVATPSLATGRADRRELESLLDVITASCFFSMNAAYSLPISGEPSAHVTVTMGTKQKTVMLHPASPDGRSWDGHCKPPKALYDITKRIDAVAKTEKWIGRKTPR